jgi:hypothetical protein
VNHHAPGTYTGTFTVPATAVPGTTLMRITAKMSDLGGHTLPTPCDLPNPDPLGYHGETEDYTVNIINTTGIQLLQNQTSALSVFPSLISDHATISIHAANISCVKIWNALGETVWTRTLHDNEKNISLGEDMIGNIQPGVYFIEATGSDTREIKKVMVQ